jgi:hypothetical protein
MSRVSPLTLPWPEGWPTPRRIKWTVAFSYLGLMSIVCLGFGVAGLVTGDLAQGVFLLWGGLFCLVVVAQGALTRLLVRRVGTAPVHSSTIPETGEAAVVIPYSTNLFRLMIAVPVMLLLAAGAIAVGSIVEVVKTGDGNNLVIALISFIVVGYLVASLGQVYNNKIACGFVALSARGIYHRSWALTSFVRWEDVVAVWPLGGEDQAIRVQVAANSSGWSRRTSRFWKQPESNFGLNQTVRGMYLSVDPALVYHALQFYFSEPRARFELTGEAGLQRLRRADIPVLTSPQ